MAAKDRLFVLLRTVVLLTLPLCPWACDRDDPSPPSASSTGTPRVRGIRVAAAADLRYALDEVVAEFQKHAPAIQVTPTYGSSGNFYAQLSNKAPFDLYFSADLDYPRRLIETGLASPRTEFLYAIGHLVLWVPKDSEIDVERLGLESLAQPAVKKVAMANPTHAPYGRAAEAAMKHLDVYDRVKERLVFGENIAQAAQFVETGAADIGILALSLALAPALRDKGRYWVVPIDAYPKLEQGGVILSWAQDVDAAQQFQAFVTGPEGRAILERYGFVLPGE